MIACFLPSSRSNLFTTWYSLLSDGMLYGMLAPRNGASGVCWVRILCATGSRRLEGIILPWKGKPFAPHAELAVEGSKIVPVSTVRVVPLHSGDGTVMVLPVKRSVKSPAFSFAVQLCVKPGWLACRIGVFG